MPCGFEKSSLDLTNENWAAIERYNLCLERLLNRRKSEIIVCGPLVKSKTAWKCATLQQSLLYRVTMLARGCAEAWNEGNAVCSVLAARALLETIALFNFIRDEMKKFADARDFNAIETLVNEHLFSTRDKGIIARGYGHEARSVLTFIDKFAKKVPKIRDHYEFISEWCHPNGSGVLFTFGEMNKQDGSVKFSELTPRMSETIQSHIMACFMMLLFVEPIMDATDDLIPLVSGMDPNEGPWLLLQGGEGQL
jgi:hypothetical protein